jgi:hypothetical protein
MTSLPPQLADLLSPEQQQTLAELIAQLTGDTNPLLQVLKPGQLCTLAAALLEVQTGTGYGAVELVIADGRVQTVKVVKSMRA